MRLRGRALSLKLLMPPPARTQFVLFFSYFPLPFSSRFFHLHCSPCPRINLGQTVVHKQPYQPQHLGFVKSFADEFKLIFHLIPEAIRLKLVTFSGHKAPGMFYSLSVLIFETSTCKPFQGWETSLKFQPTMRRFCIFPWAKHPHSSLVHPSYLVAYLSPRASCS